MGGQRHTEKLNKNKHKSIASATPRCYTGRKRKDNAYDQASDSDSNRSVSEKKEGNAMIFNSSEINLAKDMNIFDKNPLEVVVIKEDGKQSWMTAILKRAQERQLGKCFQLTKNNVKIYVAVTAYTKNVSADEENIVARMFIVEQLYQKWCKAYNRKKMKNPQEDGDFNKELEKTGLAHSDYVMLKVN